MLGVNASHGAQSAGDPSVSVADHLTLANAAGAEAASVNPLFKAQ